MVLHKWIGFSPVEATSDGAMDRFFNMHYLCVCGGGGGGGGEVWNWLGGALFCYAVHELGVGLGVGCAVSCSAHHDWAWGGHGRCWQCCAPSS